MHIVFAQDFLDGLDAGLNRGLVAGGTVLPQQVFKNKGGNDRIAFDRLDEILADNKPRKPLINSEAKPPAMLGRIEKAMLQYLK
jgi:hypothetical protein